MKKIYELKEFLKDPLASTTTGLIASHKKRFCFVIKNKQNWKKLRNGKWEIPFGGIGGHLENGEKPTEALEREAKEEVGTKIKIESWKGETIFISPNEKIRKIKIKNFEEKRPIIIQRIKKEIKNDEPFLNNFIYLGKFLSKSLKPFGEAGIIEMDLVLLLKTFKYKISIEEFKKSGGLIISKIKLPSDGILKPIGTARAFSLCLLRKKINVENNYKIVSKN